ncbi:alpha/beta fold hydrolase [Permianibacter sp. IMCC34836]|uniref:alpha/beta fold hydrolase n=1 Tax=Permianibacter fluminis TaxID=2738515 RepID=UPI001555BE83|nr:alpha/beta hydrolase [Permianibacter fluminis]NQD36447.1 alpha/beta fold hydrolase [Permianibacter fluminis]
MSYSMLRSLLFCLATIVLTACASPAVPSKPNTPLDAATPPSWRSELAEVDGEQLEYWLSRAPQARATLVFENGLMLPLTTWQTVASAFTERCNVLVYNRAGVGRSSVPEEAQAPEHTAQQLQRLLQQLMPDRPSVPTVLVGHSLGGQYVQLFARQYPELVSGIVLVDALPVGTVKPVAEFPWYTRFGLWLFAPESAQREISHIAPMGEALLANTDPFQKPMVRLVAATDPVAHKPEGLIKDLLKGALYAEDFGVWALDPDVAEARMNELYPQASVRVLQTPHRIQESNPAAVIDAINLLLDSIEHERAQANIDAVSENAASADRQ